MGMINIFLDMFFGFFAFKVFINLLSIESRYFSVHTLAYLWSANDNFNYFRNIYEFEAWYVWLNESGQ